MYIIIKFDCYENVIESLMSFKSLEKAITIDIFWKGKVILSFSKGGSERGWSYSIDIGISKYGPIHDAIKLQARHTVCRFLQHWFTV